jgi:hypothetical protein
MDEEEEPIPYGGVLLPAGLAEPGAFPAAARPPKQFELRYEQGLLWSNIEHQVVEAAEPAPAQPAPPARQLAAAVMAAEAEGLHLAKRRAREVADTEARAKAKACAWWAAQEAAAAAPHDTRALPKVGLEEAPVEADPAAVAAAAAGAELAASRARLKDRLGVWPRPGRVHIGCHSVCKSISYGGFV